MAQRVDMVVVGGGHAGCEAAAAAARLGREVVLVSFRREHIARLSCNPAIGGLAKGCLVRELDALGGLMAQVADQTTIQFRRLNTRKGLAVQSSRAQVDVHAYPRAMQARLDAIPGLRVMEAECTGLLIEDGRVAGVRLGLEVLRAPKVVLTTGTFLGGKLFAGDRSVAGGRIGESGAQALAEDLTGLPLRLTRLKTGTPPRLRADSIDYSRLERQGDTDGRFSFVRVPRELDRVGCWIGYTNQETHRIIADNLERSAMYGGLIEGVGPRYCPSVEDKVARFPQRDRHQLFLEPEGHETDRVYVNGLSTSLPESVQVDMVHSVVGLEQAEIVQFGYAVEYVISDPRDLGPDLQHRSVPGLYMAGQINGTSGYEEAAVQGFVAGVSAARDEPFRLGRDQAYIGVLIDDLITRGIGGEPYRMFSSRAEHRLLLREDNADRRLTPTGIALGLVEGDRASSFRHKLERIAEVEAQLQAAKVVPSPQRVAQLKEAGVGSLRKPATLAELLKRPGVTLGMLAELFPEISRPADEVAEQVETDIKYAGYIQREQARAAQTRKLAQVSLAGLDYDAVPGLSTEVRQRLSAARPDTLASAARLPAITPAAITTLAIHLGKNR